MNVDWVRQRCMSFPHSTEQVTWGSDLTFRVAGKIFAVTVLEPAPVWLSFKCSPESFAELTERPGIIPAPYLARAQWVALETREALPVSELSELLRKSYELVLAKIPKKMREALHQTQGASKPARRRRSKNPARKPANK
jgi:predicted DNA-binding protein (MmcQ/YjbR family)